MSKELKITVWNYGDAEACQPPISRTFDLALSSRRFLLDSIESYDASEEAAIERYAGDVRVLLQKRYTKLEEGKRYVNEMEAKIKKTLTELQRLEGSNDKQSQGG